MALTVLETTDDRPGLSIVCDSPGCDGHVTVVSAEPGQTPEGALETAVGWARDEGWCLPRPFVAWCPVHRWGVSHRHMAS